MPRNFRLLVNLLLLLLLSVHQGDHFSLVDVATFLGRVESALDFGFGLKSVRDRKLRNTALSDATDAVEGRFRGTYD
jgi:hypothetical protein